MLSWLGSVPCCLIGIYIGLGNEYADWTPSFDRVFFAMAIAAIPFLLPFAINMIAIPMLWQSRRRQIGIAMLVLSYLLALVVGIAAVRMGNF